MLPHYSSLKVAEQFRVLEAIAPGRIDLGLGRAPGSDGRTAFALNPNANTAADQFPGQVRDVIAWSSGAPLVEGHPFRSVRAQPQGPTVPEVWILGSSDYGAQVAAHFGLPYCFAAFITDGEGAAEAMSLYRDTYNPASATQRRTARSASGRSPGTPRPRPSGCSPPAPCGGWGAIGPVRAVALARGSRAPPIHRQRARACRAAEAARHLGTAARVGARLREIAANLQVEEVAILTTVHDPAARRQSYSLLAEEFALTADARPAAAD